MVAQVAAVGPIEDPDAFDKLVRLCQGQNSNHGGDQGSDQGVGQQLLRSIKLDPARCLQCDKPSAQHLIMVVNDLRGPKMVCIPRAVSILH